VIYANVNKCCAMFNFYALLNLFSVEKIFQFHFLEKPDSNLFKKIIIMRQEFYCYVGLVCVSKSA